MKPTFLRRSRKLLPLIVPLAVGTSALHAQNAVVATNEVQSLPPIVVTGRSDSLLGIADSAGVGTVGAAQLQARPIMRPGELLETIPGVIITQHSGAGKANQYYLRGFNLDHGTDLAMSHSRFRDEDPAGRYIPGSIETVAAAGVAVHDLRGFFGSLRVHYFGPRSLIEDDSVRSGETIQLNAQIGYQFNKTWTLSVQVFNLLNRKDSDVDYYYESRLPGEPVNPDPNLNGGYNDVHFHPVEPIAVRVGLTARF